MSQTYNDNRKRPKLKENQLEILGISSREFTHSVGNSVECLGSGRERCWGHVSSLRMHPKVATSLSFSGSGKGAVGA